MFSPESRAQTLQLCLPEAKGRLTPRSWWWAPTEALAVEGQPKHQQWHIKQHCHSPTASLWRATSQKSASEAILHVCLLCGHTHIEHVYIFYYLYSSFGMNKTVTACKTWKNIIYIKVLDKMLLQTMLQLPCSLKEKHNFACLLLFKV